VQEKGSNPVKNDAACSGRR